jgi:hypothetical protein
LLQLLFELDVIDMELIAKVLVPRRIERAIEEVA